MKRHILLISTSFFATLVFAQQRVGINEVAPTSTLEVKGSGTGSGTSNFLLKNSNNTVVIKALDNGRIGIGTATPVYLVDIANRIRLREGVTGSLSTTPGIWMNDYRDGTERVFVGMRDSIRFGFYGSGAGGAGWAFNFNAKNGNIGVGSVSDDTYKLTLSGSNYGISLSDGLSSYGNFYTNDSKGLVITSRYGGGITCVGCPPPPTPKPLLLNPPDDNVFAPLTSGNVGIYMAAPTAKLHVGGNVMIGDGTPAAGYELSVNGRIICEEAKVQLKTAWPDYVFAPSYQKPTLYSIEKFIKKNKHLPNIPNAATIEKDGLELGDMQKRLMEKVEELTLYMIELKKENDQLKKQFIQFKKQRK
ncbi:MAG: hypothetical protein V4722_07535 [Bacteroidota bacterium]